MTTTRSHGPRYDLVPPPPTKVDGPTMWARWKAFDDSAYQELKARERDRERQRLERIRAQRRENIRWAIAALVFLVVCLSLWAGVHR